MYIVYYTLYPYITVMVRFTLFVLCDDVVLNLCVIFLSVVKSAKYYSTYYDV
jgi:hypothetical protein